jgi:hypothetical protein
MTMIDKIIAYEEGTLDEDETIALFQTLIDTGTAWTLQGSYGRMAASLIEAGQCRPAPPIPITFPAGPPAPETYLDSPCELVESCNREATLAVWALAPARWVPCCRYHAELFDL